LNREEQIKDDEEKLLFKQLMSLHGNLDNSFLSNYNRSLPFNETFVDRWERARKLGFGDQTNIYDSSIVLGNLNVGSNCWIGPYTILDGSGGLYIGNYVTISAGVQIYTHDNIKQTLSSFKVPIERNPIKISNNVYIGPNSIITKGVEIGDFCVIGAGSFVNKNIESNTIVAGQPAKPIGKVIIEGDEINFKYFEFK